MRRGPSVRVLRFRALPVSAAIACKSAVGLCLCDESEQPGDDLIVLSGESRNSSIERYFFAISTERNNRPRVKYTRSCPLEVVGDTGVSQAACLQQHLPKDDLR